MVVNVYPRITLRLKNADAYRSDCCNSLSLLEHKRRRKTQNTGLNFFWGPTFWPTSLIWRDRAINCLKNDLARIDDG